MGNEIEIVFNGDELAVFGSEKTVENFIKYVATIGDSAKLNSGQLASFLSKVSSSSDAVSKISETSARWLKLTPESAKKISDLGLMPSAKHGKGIAHAILGEPGEIAGWLQVEVGPKSLLTNPAVLSGVSNFLSQQALQMDLKYIKEMLANLDEKLDEVIRTQVMEHLSNLDGIVLAIDDAKTKMIHNHGIVNSVSWSQLDAQSFEIGKLQGFALRKLQDIQEKALQLRKISSAPTELSKLESEISLWLTVLGKTMELREELANLELAAVEHLSSDQLSNHTSGVRAALLKRRGEIYDFIGIFLIAITKSSSVALDNVILHSKKANQTINILNQIASTGHLFNAAFGDATQPQHISKVSVEDAIREPKQVKTALVEVAKVGGSVVLASLMTVVAIVKVKDK